MGNCIRRRERSSALERAYLSVRVDLSSGNPGELQKRGQVLRAPVQRPAGSLLRLGVVAGLIVGRSQGAVNLSRLRLDANGFQN
ncbi:MAG TPA: hypothetical protein QGI30_05050, partial [Anaerolineales bacterium]|nr:hypothetical protein [Anaerolineales bacterium]